MSRNRSESKFAERHLTAVATPEAFEPDDAPTPEILHRVDEQALATMQPGDVLVLSETQWMWQQVEPAFHAVLACPACGELGLLTYPQYSGAVSVMCGSSRCGCCLRIEDTSHIVYLPVN